MKSIPITVNILVDDDFDLKAKVAEEYEEDIDDVTDEDIREYLENNISPAESNVSGLEVEGGDCDGWFIQSVDTSEL